MAKKIPKLFLLFLVLLVVIIFVAYKFALPVFIEKKLEEGLKREVSLGRVSLDRLRAIELRNLVIYEKGQRGKKFLQARELNFNYQFQPLFQSLKEKGRDPKNWHLEGEMSSSEIVIKGCRIKNVYLPIRLHESRLEVANLRGDFYRGRLQGSFRLDLTTPQPGYTFTADISKADLDWLVRDVFSKREIAGRIDAELVLRGRGSLAEASGQGSVRIDEARLWKIPLLGGLAAFLRIPSYEKVVFDEVKGSFTIAEGTVRTEDLSLISDQVRLFIRGYLIDAERNLDLMVRTRFSKGLLERVPILGKIFSFLVDEAGNAVVQVRVRGPINHPEQIEYKIAPIPIMRSLKEFLEGTSDEK